MFPWYVNLGVNGLVWAFSSEVHVAIEILVSNWFHILLGPYARISRYHLFVIVLRIVI